MLALVLYMDNCYITYVICMRFVSFHIIHLEEYKNWMSLLLTVVYMYVICAWSRRGDVSIISFYRQIIPIYELKGTL